MGDEREREGGDGFSTQFAAPLMRCRRPPGTQTDGLGPGKKVPLPRCCLFQQHRLTNCMPAKRRGERRGIDKGQIELEVSYSARESERAVGG